MAEPPIIRTAQQLCEGYMDALNTHNIDGFDQVLPADFRSHTRVGDITGRDRFKLVMQAMYAAFPDAYWTIQERIVTDDRVVLRYIFEGTHRAPFLGIPATQKWVRAEGLELLHCIDGWLVEIWNYSDTMGLAAQLHYPRPLELEV